MLRNCLTSSSSPPCVFSSPFPPLHTQTPLTTPCSLPCWPPCYDAPWLGSYRYKPAAADNAPDGDAPSLPHKQDAQPWGETTTPPPHQLESGHRPIPTVSIPLDLMCCFFCITYCLRCLRISLCSNSTYSPFSSLTHCVCVSKASQIALPVYSCQLICGNTYWFWKIRSDLCNTCDLGHDLSGWSMPYWKDVQWQ